MRVCLVSREFAPFWGAGIGTYASEMARAWAAAGHEVHVLSANHPGLMVNGPRLRPGVRFHVAQPPPSPMEREACRLECQRRSMNVFRTLERLHERVLFDYVEFPDYFAEGYFALRAKRTLRTFSRVVLGVRLHTPTVLCRRLNHETDRTDEIATLEHMEGEAIRDADVLVSPSRALLSWVHEHVGVADDQPDEVVPYPFDESSVRELRAGPALPRGGRLRRERDGSGARAPAPDAAPPPAPEPEVLYFGRLERRKGVEHLVEAGRHLLDGGLRVRFRLIGGDTHTGPGQRSMLEHLRSRVMNVRPDRFVFEGPRPRAELGEAIRRATIVCFPALWDNFPNALLEAMALGACVVASDAGGMAEIVEDGASGVLFHGGNTTNLAATLRRVLADEELRREVASAARARVMALCEPRAVVEGMVRAIERAREGPRFVPALDPSASPPAGGLPVPVPYIRAREEDGGLVARLRRLAGKVRSRVGR